MCLFRLTVSEDTVHQEGKGIALSSVNVGLVHIAATPAPSHPLLPAKPHIPKAPGPPAGGQGLAQLSLWRTTSRTDRNACLKPELNCKSHRYTKQREWGVWNQWGSKRGRDDLVKTDRDQYGKEEMELNGKVLHRLDTSLYET